MKPLKMMLILMLGLDRLTVSTANAQSIVTGETRGAYYKFAVPASWNGDLVIFNDGLNLAPIAPYPANAAMPLSGLGPLADLQFSQGFALAATTRSDNGWAFFRSTEDIVTMIDAFERKFHRPRRILMTGQSVGGLVAVQAIESGFFGNVAGALLMCPALTGSRNWDLALDLRLVYDALCSDVPGAAIPGGAEGLPPGMTLSSAELAGAVNQCTGILAPPANRSADQQARLNKILSVTGLPENFLLTDMTFATVVMSDLVHDPDKLNGRIGTGNSKVDYGDPEINSSIQRVSPDPVGKRRLKENYTPTGRLNGVRVVSIHTDKDGLVIVENEDDYSTKAPRSLFSSAIAVEGTASHCGFTPAEAVGAWESLRHWVGGSPQPTSSSIQASCKKASDQFGGACRFFPDIDLRIRPRKP